MSLPELKLVSDTRGLPAIQIGDVVLPLTRSVTEPVTDEMAESLLDRLRADYSDELPDTWATQAAWDNALTLKLASSPIDRVGRLALSLYGWLTGAAAANQAPDKWLLPQLSGRRVSPGTKPETIWTIQEGRSDNALRALGAVGDQVRGRQAWQSADRNQPLGPRGGHQEIWTEDLVSHLDPAVDAIRKTALPALWLRPGDLDWPTLATGWRPSALVDPYPIKNEAAWRRLKLELTGRRLATTLWITDELLGGATVDDDLAHGVAWQIQRYQTLSELLAVWQDATASGWRSMLIEPETISGAAWLTFLANALNADYIWLNRP